MSILDDIAHGVLMFGGRAFGIDAEQERRDALGIDRFTGRPLLESDAQEDELNPKEDVTGVPKYNFWNES